MHSTKTETTNQTARITQNSNSMDEFLSTHDIKPTRQRVVIANFIFEKEQHLSADVILDCINNDYRTISVSKATVYNTLNLFVKNGILREVIIDSQKVLYDTNTEHHHHIFNIDNGEIRDIQPVQINLSEAGVSQQDIDISQVDLIIKVRTPPNRLMPAEENRLIV